MRRGNQFGVPKAKLHQIGIFTCDTCNAKFEIEHNLQQKLSRQHHFCSRKCQGLARKHGGCLNYVYDTFENSFKRKDVRDKIKATMLERYGATSTHGSALLHEKAQQTMLARYGATTSFAAPSLKVKFDFKEMARKRHVTMKREGSYKLSKEEIAFGKFLSMNNVVETNVLMNNVWPIDFFLPEQNTYVQYDGVYWHGLDRDIEFIKNSQTPRDKVIYQKWCTDREQERWFNEQGLKLVRVRSDQFDAKTMTCSVLSF